jgi:DNA-binding transcriptional LysR family regulator
MRHMINGVDAESATKILPHLAAFVVVVESGSYTAAARRMGVDKTVLSRRVATLERALGARLLQRTTRSLSLTEAGRKLHGDVCGPLRDTIAALLAAGEATQIEGTVRVAALPIAGPDVLAPAIKRLRALHPKLTVDLRGSDSYVDLVGQGIDLALRSGHQPDSSMVAQRLGTWGFVLCAAPGWLEKHRDRIRCPEDVKDDWILYGGVRRASQWRFARDQEVCEVHARATATIDSAELQMQLVATGVGVGALPAPLVRHELETGRLVRVLPRWRIDHQHALSAVLPSRDHVPLRVRAVIDVLKAQVHKVQPLWDAVAAGG